MNIWLRKQFKFLKRRKNYLNRNKELNIILQPKVLLRRAKELEVNQIMYLILMKKGRSKVNLINNQIRKSQTNLKFKKIKKRKRVNWLRNSMLLNS